MQRYERGLLGHCLSVFQLPHRLPFRVLYKLPISYVSRRSLLFPSPLCRLCSTGLLSPTQCAPLPMLSRFNAVAHETSARHGGVQGKHQKLFRCSYRLARVLSPLGRTSSRLEIYAACMGDYEGAAAPAGTLQEVQIPKWQRAESPDRAGSHSAISARRAVSQAWARSSSPPPRLHHVRHLPPVSSPPAPLTPAAI